MIHYKIEMPMTETLEMIEESVKNSLIKAGVKRPKITAIPHPDKDAHCYVFFPKELAWAIPVLIGVEE